MLPTAIETTDTTLAVSAGDLRTALVRAGKAIDRRAFVDVLKCVHIYTAGGQVVLEGQIVGEYAARITCAGAEAGEGFDVLLDHKQLSAALKGADKRATVTLELDGDAVKVGYGAASFTIKQGNRQDWLGVAFGLDGARALLVADGSTFAGEVAAVASHASTDDTRPILTGVRVETVDGDSARLVATDSYRLIVREIACETFAPELAYTIPAAPLAIATAKASGDVALFVDGDSDREWVTVSRDGETWRIRTIVGQYPNWSMLMPEPVCEVTFDRAELLAALQNAARVAEKNAPVQFAFGGPIAGMPSCVKSLMMLEVQNDGAQAAYAATVGYRVSIHNGWIGANAGFAVDAVAALEGETVTLGISTPLRPMLWSSRQGSTRVLVVPIRLNR